MSSSRPPSRQHFTIALICALSKEFDAVRALFDRDWEAGDYPKYDIPKHDENSYAMGRIGVHDVVLTLMPNMGKRSAATSSTDLRSSFSGIILGLLVGICGGAPSQGPGKKEIILGDVIVSTLVVQYDLGHQYADKLVRKDTIEDNLRSPNRHISGFIKILRTRQQHASLVENTLKYLDELHKQGGLETSRPPGIHHDILHESTYRHKHQDPSACDTCAKCKNKEDKVCDIALSTSCDALGCDPSKQIRRLRHDSPQTTKPFVHFGVVASGDSVVKSAHHRDDLIRNIEAIGFEMEGAGVWDKFPTVIIKGVADYADSHKAISGKSTQPPQRRHARKRS